MLFRCSVCRGQFDVEQAQQKPVIFCSHCGAALRTGKAGANVGVASPALQALGGGNGSPLDEIAGQAQGFMEALSPPAAAPTYAPAAPEAAAAADPLAALSGATSPGASRSIRRPIRKKKDNTAAIMIVSAIGVVVLFIVIGVIIFVVSRPDPIPPKTIYTGGRDPGELFPTKAPEPARARAPKAADEE